MTVVDLYTLQLVRTYNDGSHPDLAVGRLADVIAEAEENLTDLLPPGYRARIRRWDTPSPDDDPGEDEDE